MAIFHLSAKVIGRSAGRSVVAAAAYRAGVELADERTGTFHDYRRKRYVDQGEILAPEGTPEALLDRSALWNCVEATETRKDAQLAREVEFSLPMELSERHARRMALDFVRRQFVDRGMIADVTFHNLGRHNPHAHVLLTMRRHDGQKFGGKERAWNAPALLSQWREAWAKHANVELARAKKDVRIDHRTLEAQRDEAKAKGDRLAAISLDRPAQIHVGYTGNAERAQTNNEIQERGLVQVALATLKEQERAETKADEAWNQLRAWQDTHGTRVDRVEKWRRANPRLTAFFKTFGQVPAKLKKLIEERDFAERAVTGWGKAIDRFDERAKLAREFAKLIEARREAAKHGGPSQIPPNPAPRAPEQAPAAPAPRTPEEARKRRYGR